MKINIYKKQIDDLLSFNLLIAFSFGLHPTIHICKAYFYELRNIL